MARNRPLVILLPDDVTRGDIETLCERGRRLIERCEGRRVICDAGHVAVADATIVDALARLEVTSRRLGRSIAVRGASEELRELTALMGLTQVLPTLVEPAREPEQREQALGIEEERDPRDRAV